jgi:hypothetical protein
VAIARLRGYDGQIAAATWRGRHDLNAVYGDYLLPLITAPYLAQGQELVCLVYTGRAAGFDPARLLHQVASVTWHADGDVVVVWTDGREDRVEKIEG